MCEKCGGTGWIWVYDSVPYGSTNVSMPSSEMCDCLDRDECPSCGAELERSEGRTMYGKVNVLSCECGYRTEY